MTARPSDSLVHSSSGSLSKWLVFFFALAAIAFGVFAAWGSSEWLAFVGVVIVVLIAAWTLPESFLTPILIGLVAAQFYFPVPGASANLRGALIFVAAVALRIGLTRPLRRRAWMLPAALFLLVAFVAALGAPDRYAAFKGIYEWGAVFLTAFVAGELIASRAALTRAVIVLVAIGVVEALVGLAQAALGVDRVIAILRAPLNEIFFQPNLLRERLTDLSFNWILYDRILPFGNFINAVDYAVFLAAILVLALSFVIAGHDTAKQSSLSDVGIASRKPLAMTPRIILLVSILAMGAALLLTFKGSGLLALAGGALMIALFFLNGTWRLPRLTPRTLVVGSVLALATLVFAAPFADLLVARAAFLIQRETGAVTSVGRLAVWAQLIPFLTQRPFFGFGLNNAIPLIEPIPTLIGGAFAYTTPAPESSYVAMLIETGLLGFSALMSLFAVTLVQAWHNARKSKDAIHVGIIAAFVALLVGNLTVAGLTTDQNGMLFGLLLGISSRNWRLAVGS
ncbi:hypothetical protein ANRL1_01964 [Anaerolineae bacterium]|nr:hypothetical protein ANRL1_01964 [Anaerolineae bacterium]